MHLELNATIFNCDKGYTFTIGFAQAPKQSTIYIQELKMLYVDVKHLYFHLRFKFYTTHRKYHARLKKILMTWTKKEPDHKRDNSIWFIK